MDTPTLIKLAVLILLLFITLYYIVYKMVLCLWEHYKIARQGKAAEAVVLQHTTSQDSDGATFYHPVLQYTTTEGKAVTVVYNEGYGSEEDRPVGQRCTIYYLPGEPGKVVFARSLSLHLWMGLLLGLAAAGLIVVELAGMLQ